MSAGRIGSSDRRNHRPAGEFGHRTGGQYVLPEAAGQPTSTMRISAMWRAVRTGTRGLEEPGDRVQHSLPGPVEEIGQDSGVTQAGTRRRCGRTASAPLSARPMSRPPLTAKVSADSDFPKADRRAHFSDLWRMPGCLRLGGDRLLLEGVVRGGRTGMTGTPLLDWLSTLDQGALAGVLAVRPDVCGPTEPGGPREAAEPGGLGELAERLQQRQSVEQALKRLTRPCAQVAETAAALGPDATRASITALLGGPDAAVDDALTALERHALVWPGHGGVLHVAGTLRERWPVRHEEAWRPSFDPFPPELPTVTVDPERVELTAAARLGEFVGHVAGVLAECARRPLQVFKAAGIRPKALERVMAAARCDEASARLALACAQRAGLLVSDGTHVRLSPGGDAFTFLPSGEQAARLLFAWWRLPSTPTRTRSDDGRQRHPLREKAVCGGCVEVRRELVRVLRGVPEGQGVRTRQDLARTLAWRRALDSDHATRQTPHRVLQGAAVR